MRSEGNGKPEICMLNLLRLHQGEVRFDILRGIDSSLVDMPETIATPRLRAEAYWLVSRYEPRITFSGITTDSLEEFGNFTLTATGNINA